MIKAVRGTRDLLPPETALWNFVEEKVREVMRAYNFQEIRTPIFESTELFARGVGEETDIVAKEMYTWEDLLNFSRNTGSSIWTSPRAHVRAYCRGPICSISSRGTVADASSRRHSWHRPRLHRAQSRHRGLNKLYCIGPKFRRERPQKGRYRQFYQIDAEVIGPASAGSESPSARCGSAGDAGHAARPAGDHGLESGVEFGRGCANDRAAFNEALRKALEPVVAQMCADCQRRAVTNPLRVFDCKVPADQPIIEKPAAHQPVSG